MRRHGQPPWRWREGPSTLGRPPSAAPALRTAHGCAFGALIVLAALGASTLVSLLWRSPRQVGKLALAHGGDIGIESAPGKGTEVTVSLPRGGGGTFKTAIQP